VKDLLQAIKDNKRIYFCALAIVVAVANHFGFADFVLDENIAIIIAAGVPLILSLLRTYNDI